jgi:hypothetical protein
VAILLASGVARAQHGTGPGEEGTPDPQPRRVELETRPTEVRQRQEVTVVRRPPRVLPYYDWAPIPWGYRLKMGSGRYTLLLFGTLLLGTGHFASQMSSVGVAMSCSSSRFNVRTPDCGKHVAELELPVVGPWFALAGHGAGEPKWVYPILGSAQGIGFLMILVGATLDDKRLERDDRKFPLGQQVSLEPSIGPGEYGLGLRGTF